MSLLTVLAFVLLAVPSASGAGHDDILGMWKTEKGDVQLEFFKCGEKICGRIVGLQEPRYTDSGQGPVGETKKDRKNPDPALRDRPVIGLQVMEGVTSTGSNTWGGGACYDPQSGNTYKCKMKLASPDRLEMRGFIGVSLFGRNYVLVR